jgi:hypothetical protein
MDRWNQTGVKIVLYCCHPLFAAMKAVDRLVVSLKEKGSIQEILEQLSTCREYARVVELDRWLAIHDHIGISFSSKYGSHIMRETYESPQDSENGTLYRLSLMLPGLCAFGAQEPLLGHGRNSDLLLRGAFDRI